ncbi:hypothetical protein NDU88_004673 [Pleurodeles waltl]|uniref:Uncharacterized protein n=1 Tax=Pleurodeles waltl TaxID=8319 RepID=A0AAV7T8T3_PLEWA|nr:hypothetical protein NDU88_004673 [Pleurodeles waltl]
MRPFFTELTNAWDWVDQSRYGASSPSSPDHQHRNAKNMNRKRRMSHCCPNIPIQGVPFPEQAKEEQAEALTAAVSLWVDRRSPHDFSLENNMSESTSMHSEDSITLILLPNVTPQRADEIL